MSDEKMSKTAYMNNFTFSMQNLTCVLDARTQTLDIEKSNFGTVLDDKKIIDENYTFMPVEVAQELAISILHVVSAHEKRTGFRVRLEPEKQAIWDNCVKMLDEYYQKKKENAASNPAEEQKDE